MTDYTQMGMAALLPVMQYMIELMQTQLDEMRIKLAALQGMSAEPEKKKANGHKAYWDRMTRKQRADRLAKMQAGKSKAARLRKKAA